MTAPSFTYSGNVYTAAAAGSTDFALTSTAGNPIAYLEAAHIHVYKSANQGVTWTELTRPAQWNFVSSGTVARLATGIANGEWVKVQRITPTGSAYVTFQSSSLLTAEQLNDDTLFNTYLNQEISDQSDQTVTTADSAVATANSAVATANSAAATANSTAAAAYLRNGSSPMTGNVATGGYRIVNVGTPSDGSDAATKAYTDNLVSTSIDAALTTDVIAGDAITITDNSPSNGQIVIGVTNAGITAPKIADGSITTAKLSDATVVVNAEQAGATANDTSFFTTQAADSRYFRQDSSETISSGQPWSSSDSYVATTAAIDARIIDLVDDVGGFVPIVNETSFPANNPDINNPDGSGTIISVKEIVTTRTPVSGTVTIAGGSGANTVTITGCGSTVLPSGFGVLVETTTTLHTYVFHRLVPKATEVTTVASISGNVTTVAGISANVTTVATNSASVTTVSSNIVDVQTVAADLNEPVSEIETVAGAIANVNAVGNSISSVNTVAANNANVTTVAGSIGNVGTVAGSIANVNTTGSNIASINTVAANNANVTTVAGISGNVTTVAGISGNVSTVAGISGNVTTVATNLASVVNASTYLNAFLALYLGQGTSDPALDALGNPITPGDLYFNTLLSQIRVYNGAAWQTFAENAFGNTYFPNEDFSAVYTAAAGSNSINLGDLAIAGGVFPDENSPTNRMSLALGAGSYNLGGL